MNLNAHETILQPILEGTKQYIVPLFQRTYSWKIKNWKTLWEDLLALYTSNNSKQHFIGAIVSMPVEMNPSGVNKYLLIDGQQRITTLFLILTAMRDVAKQNGSILAEQINDSYLINKYAQGTNQLKLFPSQADREQFSAIIHRSDNFEENNNLVAAYKYYKRKLEGNEPSGHPFDLERLHQILIKEIMVVDIVLDRDENPYLIFESLNAKGEPLTQADLVRNYILMRITNSDEQEMAYRDFWLPMQETLDSELTPFLWRYLIKDSNNVKTIRLNEIYDEVKLILMGRTSSQVIDFLMDVHTYSNYYQCLLAPSKEANKDIQKKLQRIRRWDVKTTYPLLLNIYHDYKENLITPQEFCKILEALESFVVRRAFCGERTNALNKIFLGLYKSIDTTNYVNSLIIELLKKKWPGDLAFREAWSEFSIYSSGTSKCRHILESLESAFTINNEPVDLTHAPITIEHIMPQTLNEEWEQELGENARDIHDTYLHSIGNLTLSGSNSEMGNAPLSIKRRVFSESNFAISKDIANSIVWTDKTIKLRATKLFEKAKDIWWHPGFSNETTETSSNTGPTGQKPTGFSIFGIDYRVNTWREMLINVLSELAERHGDDFTQNAIKVNTGRRIHISDKPEIMHTPKEIPGSTLWVEANQSARSVLMLIDRVLVALDESEEDFEAYW